MIKVLKKAKIKKITCSECEAILSYEEEDINKRVFFNPSGDSEVRECIICPECEENIYIGEIQR